jgi:hypothetical protein
MNHKYTKEMLKEMQISDLSDFSYELEKAWRRSRLKFTDKELISLFPEARVVIPKKIEEWKEVLNMRIEVIKSFLKDIYRLETDDFSKWFGERIIEAMYFPDIKEINGHIGRLQRQLMLDNAEQGGRIAFWSEQVERARGRPIVEIANQSILLKMNGDKYSAQCPFHEDKTPSFYLYPETNTYHCFGCQAHGDVINLTMQLYGLSFKEAIRMLNQ